MPTRSLLIAYSAAAGAALALQELLQIARGLADALLVLDERDAHEAVAVFAEARARGDGDLGAFHQPLGELHRAQCLNCSGSGAQANIEALGFGTSQPALAKLSTSTSRRCL